MTAIEGRAKILSKLRLGVDYELDNYGNILFHSPQVALFFERSIQSITEGFRGTEDTDGSKASIASALNQFFDYLQWPVKATVKNQTYRMEGSVVDIPMGGHLQISLWAMK